MHVLSMLSIRCKHTFWFVVKLRQRRKAMKASEFSDYIAILFYSLLSCEKNIGGQINHHLSPNTSQLTKWFIERTYCFKHLKMFIYIVALIFTPLIIFGLVHTRCLANWVRWKVRRSICNSGPPIETLTLNESIENLCTPERSFDIIEEVANNTERLSTAPLQRSLYDSKEGSSDILLTPRYSFEDVLLPEAREKDFGSSEARARKENLFQSLKNTIEKSTNPSTRLNTTQIYNLILKETLKENLTKQKLLETEKRKINNETTSLKITEKATSSSENMSEQTNESRESLQSPDIHYLNNAM